MNRGFALLPVLFLVVTISIIASVKIFADLQPTEQECRDKLGVETTRSANYDALLNICLKSSRPLASIFDTFKSNENNTATVNNAEEYNVKPYLVYPSDKLEIAEYETAVSAYLEELQQWYGDLVGKTFVLEPLKVLHSKYDYLTIRCGENPSDRCKNDPKVLEGNVGMYMNKAIHDDVEKWETKTAALIFSAGAGGYAGANVEENNAGWGIVGDWALEPISGKENSWGIPCKYSDGWQCAGGTPKGTPAHELGHAFGLPHPNCDECSIMVAHWTYPSGGLTKDEIESLKRSPFFKIEIKIDNPSPTPVPTPTPIPTSTPSPRATTTPLSSTQASHASPAIVSTQSTRSNFTSPKPIPSSSTSTTTNQPTTITREPYNTPNYGTNPQANTNFNSNQWQIDPQSSCRSIVPFLPFLGKKPTIKAKVMWQAKTSGYLLIKNGQQTIYGKDLPQSKKDSTKTFNISLKRNQSQQSFSLEILEEGNLQVVAKTEVSTPNCSS